jgi:thiol:disulfide interchange protein DsbD
MYAEVWSDPKVQDLLRNNFVIASLYTDDRTDLPQEDWVTSSLDGKVKKTIGKKFNDLQITKFGTNALPLYVIVNSQGQIITDTKIIRIVHRWMNLFHSLRKGYPTINNL